MKESAVELFKALIEGAKEKRTLEKMDKVLKGNPIIIHPDEIGASGYILHTNVMFRLEGLSLYSYFGDDGVYTMQRTDTLVNKNALHLKIVSRIHFLDAIKKQNEEIKDCMENMKNLQLPVSYIDINVDKDKAEAAAKKLEESLEELMKYDSLKDYLKATASKRK